MAPWGDEQGWEGEDDEAGGWRRTSQYEPSGEGPGSWGPDGRHSIDPRWRADDREPWERTPVDDPGRSFPGGGKQRRGFVDFGWLGARPEERAGHGRGHGALERLRERVREGMQRLTGHGHGPKG